MLIRDARPQDCGAIFALCVEAHAATPYGHIPMNEILVRKSIAYHVGSPSQFCQVVEVDGRIEGVLIGSVFDNDFGARAASDRITYVREKARGAGGLLIRRFIRWAEKRPHIQIIGQSVSSGGSSARRTGRMLERLGLENVGSIHLKTLPRKAA